MFMGKEERNFIKEMTSFWKTYTMYYEGEESRIPGKKRRGEPRSVVGIYRASPRRKAF